MSVYHSSPRAISQDRCLVVPVKKVESAKRQGVRLYSSDGNMAMAVLVAADVKNKVPLNE